MTQENVSVPTTFFDMQRNLHDFLNQCALAHRTASSQEEWEVLLLEVLKKHDLQDDPGMTTLAYTPEDDDRPVLKVIH
jgi:hypothetical protein